MSSLKVDVQAIHTDDLQEVVGVMYGMYHGTGESQQSTHSGIPILRIDRDAIELREHDFTDKIVIASSGKSIPAEVLPGELISKDNIIRRITADECMNNVQVSAEKQFVGRKVSITEARRLAASGEMVIWRPDGNVGQKAYAVVITEGN